MAIPVYTYIDKYDLWTHFVDNIFKLAKIFKFQNSNINVHLKKIVGF